MSQARIIFGAYFTLPHDLHPQILRTLGILMLCECSLRSTQHAGISTCSIWSARTTITILLILAVCEGASSSNLGSYSLLQPALSEVYTACFRVEDAQENVLCCSHSLLYLRKLLPKLSRSPSEPIFPGSFVSLLTGTNSVREIPYHNVRGDLMRLEMGIIGR